MFEVINLTSSVKTEEINEENSWKELWLKFSKAGDFFQINNSAHLRRKYAPIFARGHKCMSLERNSFPRLKLERNCELEELVMSKDKYPSIFLTPNARELLCLLTFKYFYHTWNL